MPRNFQRIASTDSVRRAQEHYYGAAPGPTGAALEFDVLGDEEIAFIQARDSFYMASVSEDGWPYIQHRGGPPGFLRVIDEKTLGFADFKGNRQYITTGNLADNPKAYIFVMDYTQRRRVKLWGRARVVEDDPALLARLWPEGYKARDEQVIVFEVEAWDTNCPQHIPQMFHAEDVAHTIQQFQARVRELEAEVAALKGEQAGGPEQAS